MTNLSQTNAVLKELQTYEPRSMHQHQLPIVWWLAENDTVTDIEGRYYIDFTSGIFVTNVGHGTVMNAIQQQASQLIHCYTFPHLSRLSLARKISQITGYEKSFFLSAGTEATDCAIKLMRMTTNKKLIISLSGSMHGKTMCAENLRGDDGTNRWALVNSGFYHFDNAFEDAFKKDCEILLQKHDISEIAGFMIESYRGWNAKFYNKKYIQDLVKFAKRHKIPVCFDEIQGGFGRTGKLFSFEHYEIRPDLVCVGKGLGGGLPISAVLGEAKMLDLPDDLSSTHSANPLCCEAALAAIEYMENYHLVTEAKNKGKILHEFLRSLKNRHIKEVNGHGMLAAVVFDSAKSADKVIYKAMKKGLLMVRTGRESIKIGPPLTISDDKLMKGLTILKNSLYE